MIKRELIIILTDVFNCFYGAKLKADAAVQAVILLYFVWSAFFNTMLRTVIQYFPFLKQSFAVFSRKRFLAPWYYARGYIQLRCLQDHIFGTAKRIRRFKHNKVTAFSANFLSYINLEVFFRTLGILPHKKVASPFSLPPIELYYVTEWKLLVSQFHLNTASKPDTLPYLYHPCFVDNMNYNNPTDTDVAIQAY